MTQGLSVLTGMSAGATESIIVTPFEGVKIRLQDKNSTYTGAMDVIKKVSAEAGPMALYKGMEATFWRYVDTRPLTGWGRKADEIDRCGLAGTCCGTEATLAASSRSGVCFRPRRPRARR
jgi:hypothetical protein